METPSKMVPLKTDAKDFNLMDTLTDKEMSYSDSSGEKGTVVMFLCNHCPYVKLIIEAIVKVSNTYKAKGVSFVGISSNDIENYPQDAPDKMKEFGTENAFSFPYLFDPEQDVAKSYDATCTPDFFVYDNQKELVYRGRFDEARPGSGVTPTGKDLMHALDNLLEGKDPLSEQLPSVGCNIKWKK